MGREVRRVPADWKHPEGKQGYVPIEEGDFESDLKNWKEEYDKWNEGYMKDWDNKTHKDVWVKRTGNALTDAYYEWFGKRPEKEDYMPQWTEEEATHYQMYETVSEGTPISPVMASPEELARWLTDNDANASGRMTASYEGWLRVCKGGYACSAVFIDGKFQSGVEGMKDCK